MGDGDGDGDGDGVKHLTQTAIYETIMVVVRYLFIEILCDYSQSFIGDRDNDNLDKRIC